MKKILLTIAIAGSAHLVSSQESGFGLGIVVGEPTGLSAKVWTGGDRAFAFALAWGAWGRGGGYVHAHADYLFHNSNLISVSKGRMALHYGPGLRVRAWGGNSYWYNNLYPERRSGNARLGIRLPVGLTYMFAGAPVDIFLEVAPALDIVPGTSFDVNGGLGARYYF